MGQTQDESGLICLSKLSALLDDGYSLCMTCGNIQGIGPKWFWSMVLSKAQGYKRRRRSLGKGTQALNI